MNEVPLVRPTMAYSVPVSGSVHPQMSFTLVPRTPPISLMGTNATMFTPSHSKTSARPSAHSISSPVMEGKPRASLMTVPCSVPPSKITAAPARSSTPSAPTAITSSTAATDPPNPAPSPAVSLPETVTWVTPFATLTRYRAPAPAFAPGAPTRSPSASAAMEAPNWVFLPAMTGRSGASTVHPSSPISKTNTAPIPLSNPGAPT